MPTRAIYAQTKDAFWSREHPYPQMLEFACGGRVKVLEKEARLAAGDLGNYLCVMLLTLPAVNRHRGKEFLRIFRDSGHYPDLFPPEDHRRALGALLAENPDLERSADGAVKHSLFNLLKTRRPAVVLTRRTTLTAARSDGVRAVRQPAEPAAGHRAVGDT
ncbi:MAG: hypothetical protein OXG47_05020 [bacterium]|nr:hypothetical protein [bacterium]